MKRNREAKERMVKDNGSVIYRRNTQVGQLYNDYQVHMYEKKSNMYQLQ